MAAPGSVLGALSVPLLPLAVYVALLCDIHMTLRRLDGWPRDVSRKLAAPAERAIPQGGD